MGPLGEDTTLAVMKSQSTVLYKIRTDGILE